MKKKFLVGFLGMVLALGMALAGCDLFKKCEVECRIVSNAWSNTATVYSCGESDCSVEKIYQNPDPIPANKMQEKCNCN
ncbi:hypothetical protein AGMMS50255_0730 [Spirochaetia bacterium]|nr:hypothetical protein AGMMS50255_0730 [Spirochaetia bacterium]